MEFHPSQKLVTLSVREFAEYREIAQRGPAARSGIWRAAVGSSWHRALEKESAEEGENTRFEVPLDITWPYHGWRLRFQGRMDQMRVDSQCAVITEVKTVQGELPVPEEAMEDRFPGYINQLATYCVLARRVEGLQQLPIRGELLLVDIDTGIRQLWPLRQPPDTYFEAQLERLHTFLRSRWNGRQRRRSLKILPPFAEYREGQRETREALAACLGQSSTVFLEAPTGFGKTGIALECALERLREGEVERILYLTSKSTGQLQAWKQLEAMLPWDADPPRYFQVRNRVEHEAGFPETDRPLSAAELEARWGNAGLRPSTLLEKEPLTLERIRELATRSQIPPYEITRAALPFADIWLADYNYLFAPANRGLFEGVPAFNPARTLLIVDEAHNLPPRAADALSILCRHNDWEDLLHGLRGVKAPRAVRSALERWLAFLEALKPAEAHPATLEYELLDLVNTCNEALQRHPFDWSALPDEDLDLLFGITAIRSFLEHPLLGKLYHSRKSGEVELTCLDASSEIRQQLLRFQQAVLMSATLHPVEPFAQACGLDPGQVRLLEAPAPWRATAYHTAVDMRADTRWKHRERFYALTSETVRLLTESSKGPVAVFFPSYFYAQTIAEYLGASDPLLRVALQPRGGSLQDQRDFIDWSLQQSDVLFLILGTGFSEGIDALGGKVCDAMVVGPALPEVNAVQKARMRQFEGETRDQAFRRVYLIPAMLKINQALGRLVRAPGQSARVLLHCRRFADAECQDLLAPEYRGPARIRDDDALLAWLASPRP